VLMGSYRPCPDPTPHACTFSVCNIWRDALEVLKQSVVNPNHSHSARNSPSVRPWTYVCVCVCVYLFDPMVSLRPSISGTRLLLCCTHTFVCPPPFFLITHHEIVSHSHAGSLVVTTTNTSFNPCASCVSRSRASACSCTSLFACFFGQLRQCCSLCIDLCQHLCNFQPRLTIATEQPTLCEKFPEGKEMPFHPKAKKCPFTPAVSTLAAVEVPPIAAASKKAAEAVAAACNRAQEEPVSGAESPFPPATAAADADSAAASAAAAASAV